MLLPNNREELRAFYVEAWRKRRERLPAEPLEVQVADVIEQHPEYHRLLEDDPEALARDWTPEGGESNPFLHMGLHLAVREQAGTDRPAGIAAIYGALVARLGRHEAEHRIAECLAEALWQAQRNQRAPDDVSYLETLRALERDTRA
ncbi:DUF1841 family protein [Thioalkalivibrio sp. XN8]|uniref:DUF1841 family protein n=1 Tax=Thioalkalivibrio sp. XN8 TaxID=2712863 RepID=UPI003211DE96